MLVELYLDRLDVAQSEVDRLTMLLAPAEAERAERFKQAVHRTRFVVRRARLREWLGTRIGLAPAAVQVEPDSMGKPFVPGWDQHFSTSHSGDMMLIACAPVHVGCDIEAICPKLEWRPIAERFFAPEERQVLAAMADEPGRIAFFRCWTRKEAFVKALGTGLSYPLESFAVTCESQPGFERGGRGWNLSTIEVPGHAVAVATQTSHIRLRLTDRSAFNALRE